MVMTTIPSPDEHPHAWKRFTLQFQSRRTHRIAAAEPLSSSVLRIGVSRQ